MVDDEKIQVMVVVLMFKMEEKWRECCYQWLWIEAS